MTRTIAALLRPRGLSSQKVVIFRDGVGISVWGWHGGDEKSGSLYITPISLIVLRTVFCVSRVVSWLCRGRPMFPTKNGMRRTP